MQFAILKRVAVFCFKSTSNKSDPDESEIKSLNSTFLAQSSEIFDKFPSLEDRKPSTANKCVIQ